jgi:uncharacterized protein (DUF1684 family)
VTEATPPGGSDHAVAFREALQLADWRRQVAELYAVVRAAAHLADGWAHWRRGRERLFLHHDQSPLPAGSRAADRLPRYFPYDPALRVLAAVEEGPPEPVQLPPSSAEPVPAWHVGTARFDIGGQGQSLAVHWLQGYAGGLFVSFRDATSGVDTYGAGRYLIDSAKGADLGIESGLLVLDFNFAYQPSCSYDARYSCPLPPRGNWLDVPVRAGERSPEASAPVTQ